MIKKRKNQENPQNQNNGDNSNNDNNNHNKNEEVSKNVENNDDINNDENIELRKAKRKDEAEENIENAENLSGISEISEISEIMKDTEKIEENDETDETEKNENVEKTKKNKEKTELFKMAKTAAVLGILTFSTALLLSVLNSFTGPVIAERLGIEKAESVRNLFGAGIFAEELQGYEELYTDYSAQVIEILSVWNDDTMREFNGYCVKVSPKGYSGRIDMLVAVNPEGIIIDTAILSMTETAGLGTKIDDESFRGQFRNKSRNIRANDASDMNSIDIIANATVSSRAFLNGVNAALAIIDDILNDIDILDFENEENEAEFEDITEITEESIESIETEEMEEIDVISETNTNDGDEGGE